MLKQSKEASRHVEAVLSAIDIIDCFQHDPELSLKEIIERTGLTRSRVMRLIGTLESRGYLVGNPDSRTYCPGLKWPIIAKSFEKVNQVEVLIRPVLKKLAEETGESATFYVRDGIERVALAREEGSHMIRYVIREGERHLQARGGAPSKVILGFGPAAWLDEVTSSTELNIESLVKEVEKTKIQGYGLSLGENTPGAHSIAAPVYKVGGQLAGALAISGPSSRMEQEQMQSLTALVVKTAEFLSERLGSSSGGKKDIVP